MVKHPMKLITKILTRIKTHIRDKEINSLLNGLNNPRRIWRTWEHKFWGDSLYPIGPIQDYRMEGFGFGYKEGDEIQVDTIIPNMVVVGYIVDIQYENNPKDLFRLTWQPIGYLHRLKRYDKYNQLQEKPKRMFL